MPGCRSVLAAAVLVLPAAFVPALRAQESTPAPSTQSPPVRPVRPVSPVSNVQLVGADADGDRQDGEDREAGLARERAAGVAQILKQRVHSLRLSPRRWRRLRCGQRQRRPSQVHVEAPQFDVDVETERGRPRLGNGSGVNPPEHGPNADRERALGRRGQADGDERGTDRQQDEKRLSERPHTGLKANSVPHSVSWDLRET